jgi:hypothetical protein
VVLFNVSVCRYRRRLLTGQTKMATANAVNKNGSVRAEAASVAGGSGVFELGEVRNMLVEYPLKNFPW